jgi:hypothetical protein
MPPPHRHQKNTKKSTTQMPTPYSPNALITSNRIPAKADLQSAAQTTVALAAPLLLPPDLRSPGSFERPPAVFGQLVQQVLRDLAQALGAGGGICDAAVRARVAGGGDGWGCVGCVDYGVVS